LINPLCLKFHFFKKYPFLFREIYVIIVLVSFSKHIFHLERVLDTMKIAVLFGSFNPLTNAHVAALKTAVKKLWADKGLFVATNGKYLRKKTVKNADPFYLSEDERKTIIEKVCEGETNLAFWGFELGGAIPSRVKTLFKIRSDYPDAEIFEVMGSDKLGSISRFSASADYVKNFRFAVFERGEIDPASAVISDPLLCRYRHHFVLLPSLEDISSTEVRRRFYGGEDYSDIVPEAAKEVLAQYDPSDFTISYEERMKTVIGSSRFGLMQAAKEVYRENTAIFRDWKEGLKRIDVGDYNLFLHNTVLYRDEFSVSSKGMHYPETEVGCINADCVDLAAWMIKEGYNPAILNLASAGRPGGGYDMGYNAQEESLCQASNLSLSLYQFGDPKKLKCVRESGVPTREVGYPLDMNFGGIYTPNVTFFRNNKSKYFTCRENSFSCDVITVAALSFNGRNDFSKACEQLYRSADGGFTPEGEEIMLNKIRTVFRLGVMHGKDSLILGAFGCGAYRLPPKEVARLFRVVMNEDEFKAKFRLLPSPFWKAGTDRTARAENSPPSTANSAA